MKQEDAEEYTQTLAGHLGASWRQIQLAKRMGVPKALGLSVGDWVQRVGGYVKQSIAERREAVTNLTADGESTREAAEILGVSHVTVYRDVANVTAESRKASEDARKAILEATSDPEILPGIYAEDFFTGSDRIADDTVDLIFTDPPYDKNSAGADLQGTSLYRKASQTAARILKPGGSLVVYCGQKYLPDVYGLINHPALRYWWTFAGVHQGGNQMLQKLGIRCGWKPIIWYVKGTRADVSNVLLDVVDGRREKSHHDWQQAEAEALHFIEKLTFPGGLVVDFFLGGGTTKVAADALNRRFIGFEVDRAQGEKAKQRIEAA